MSSISSQLGAVVVLLFACVMVALAQAASHSVGAYEISGPRNNPELFDGVQLVGLSSNIAQARVSADQSGDLDTAAGHHHHHKHYPHGWLKMGAHSGKKGAFGWHAKYPVGGKGRR